MTFESGVSVIKVALAIALAVGAIVYINYRSSDCEAHGGVLVLGPFGFKCLRAEEVK